MHALCVCVCVRACVCAYVRACVCVCVKNRGSGRSCQGKSPRLHATFLPPQFFPSFSQSVCLCQCLLYFYGWPASSHARWIFLDVRIRSVCPDPKISKTNLHLMTHGCPSTLGPDITLCVTLRIQPFCFGKRSIEACMMIIILNKFFFLRFAFKAQYVWNIQKWLITSPIQNKYGAAYCLSNH